MSVTDGQAASNSSVLHVITNTVKLIQRGAYSVKEFVKQSNMIRMKALFSLSGLISSIFTEMIISYIHSDNSAAALSSVRCVVFCKGC